MRTHHRRVADVAVGDLWNAARSVRLCDTRTLGRLVRLRIPGLAAQQTYAEMFRAYPFTLLDEGPYHSVSGLCGRIWTLARDYPRLDRPESFRGWSESGTVRVLFAHWVVSRADGRAEIVSEARVSPVDTGANLRLRAIWSVMGRFERLVAAEPLTLAVRRARGG